ncbi:MAG: tetratricopeptide repeat protein [Terriglobales bacterium]
MTSAPRFGPVSGRFWLSLVLLLTSLAYVSTLAFDFVYDDETQIVANPRIRSWSEVPSYFTRHHWFHLYPNLPGNYYRPLFLLWLRANYAVFELKPWGWHLTTVAVHLLATLLVCFLARRLLRNANAALWAAALFGLHPVHHEAVAWVAGVSESLVAVAMLGSFLCYLRSREAGSRARLWTLGALVLFAAGLLLKEQAVLLPLLVAGHLWLSRRQLPAVPRGAWLQSFVRTLAPYGFVTAAYVAARMAVLKGFSHTVTPLEPATLLLTLPSVVWFYLRQLLWPVGLSAFYDTPYVTEATWGGFVLPLLLVVTAGAGLAWWVKRSPEAALAAGWLLAPLLPLLNIEAFRAGEFAHDRFLYVPSVGFVLLVALGCSGLHLGRARRAMQLGLVAIAGLYAAGTVLQIQPWSSNLLLYYRGVQGAPSNLLARTNLATTLVGRGLYEEAIPLYHQVLRDNSDFWLANYNLGYAYYRTGKYSDAMRFLSRAITLDPTDPDQFLFLGLARLGHGDLTEAEGAIRYALLLRPAAPGYHLSLGRVLKAQKRLPEALEEFQRELAFHSASEEARAEIEQMLSLPAGR